MRRDLDLFRELLLRLEALPVPPHQSMIFRSDDPRIAPEGRTGDEIDHHLLMMYDADLIMSEREKRDYTTGLWSFSRLTPAGRDFLDSVREPKVWHETKSRAREVGGWTLGVIGELAKSYLKSEAAKLGFLA